MPTGKRGTAATRVQVHSGAPGLGPKEAAVAVAVAVAVVAAAADWLLRPTQGERGGLGSVGGKRWRARAGAGSLRGKRRNAPLPLHPS